MTRAELLRRYAEGERDFRGLDLRATDFEGCYLRRVDLTGADLRDADLRRADLEGATLTGARGLRVPVVLGIAGLVLEQISEHPETHDQGVWHSECDTMHCVAGWVVRLAGEAGDELEERLDSTQSAAEQILRASHGELSYPLPFAPSDDPIPWLRALAAKNSATR